MKSIIRISAILMCLVAGVSSAATAVPEAHTPYGTAKADLHKYEPYKRVWDVNYDDPKKLNALVAFLSNVRKAAPGKDVVVLHGTEIRAFAKENYAKYHDVIDQLAALSKNGVDFRMCNNAMHAAGFQVDDIIGFITVIPAGFAEVSWLESDGYSVVEPLVTKVKGSRYIDHPELEPFLGDN